jgi:hypothetical protein
MESGVLVWNDDLIRTHFEAMHAADAERRNRRRQHHLAGSSMTTQRDDAPRTSREETP